MLTPREVEHSMLRLNCGWPLVGGWLRRRAARRLAKDGSPKAVGALAHAFADESQDRQVRQLAWERVQGANDQAAVAAVCQASAKTP